MKINLFTSILSLAMAGMIAFFLSYYAFEKNKEIIGIGSFLSLATTLVGTVSLSFDYERTTMLTRTTSGVFFVVILLSQVIFTFIGHLIMPTYLLVTGSSVILFSLIVYGLSKSKH